MYNAIFTVSVNGLTEMTKVMVICRTSAVASYLWSITIVMTTDCMLLPTNR